MKLFVQESAEINAEMLRKHSIFVFNKRKKEFLQVKSCNYLLEFFDPLKLTKIQEGSNKQKQNKSYKFIYFILTCITHKVVKRSISKRSKDLTLSVSRYIRVLAMFILRRWSGVRTQVSQFQAGMSLHARI